MASYHLSVRVGAKGKASGHADYIAREGKYERGARYEDLESSGHGNMPRWAEHSPREFWSASDEHERKGGSAYREIEIALPRELDPDQRRELVEDFVRRELGDAHAYQYAIHNPVAAIDGGEQPHAHIMYSQRTRDGIERDPEQYFKRYNSKSPEKGGCKKERTGETPTERKAELKALRERWADLQNEHLAKHGHHSARVDHRSLKERGIDRAPERHLGGRGVRDLQMQDIAAILEKRQAEGQLERANAAASTIDTSSSIAQAKAERERERERERLERQRQAEARRAEARERAQRIERIVDDEIKSGAMGAATPGGRRPGWSMEWVDWRARTLAEQGYQGEAMQRLAETTRVEQRVVGVRLTRQGVIINDTGGVLTADVKEGADMAATARLTVDAAQAKGWPALVLEGPREYQEAVALEARRAGIPCQMTPDVIAAIERDRQAAQAQAQAAERARILAEHRAARERDYQAQQQQAQAQAAAAQRVQAQAMEREREREQERMRWWDRPGVTITLRGSPATVHGWTRSSDGRQISIDIETAAGGRQSVSEMAISVQVAGDRPGDQIRSWLTEQNRAEAAEAVRARAVAESARGRTPAEMTDEQRYCVMREAEREAEARAARQRRHERELAKAAKQQRQRGPEMGR